MPGPYDLFISFHRHSAEPVKRLSAALEALGVACLAADGTASETGLPEGLAHAKVFLAWCCEDYFRARGCQRQLSAAYLARAREPADRPERLLLVSARASLKHIYPVPLRDRLFAYAPGLPEAPDYRELAEWLREYCEPLSGVLGTLGQPGWLEAFDRVAAPAPLFEGRERELWDIHAALHPHAPDAAGECPGPVVVVSGAAGQGKSSLLREYAFRFGPAYPGGLFRLSAGEARPAASLAELSESPALKTQLSALLRQLAPESQDETALDVPALARRLGEVLAGVGQPFLWIVDDLPDGLNGPAFRQWLAPDAAGPWGRTLVATRSRRYDGRAEPIHLPPLDEASALRLLRRGAAPAGEDEQEALAWLLGDLGRQAWATATAGALAALERRHRRGPYAALERRIQAHAREAADLAVRFPQELPPTHADGVAAVLLCAIESLEESGRSLLRLAGELGDDTLPTDFVAESFFLSGLRAEDDTKGPAFAIYLTEPVAEPLTLDQARAYAEAALAALERLSLAERTAGGARVQRLAARIVAAVAPAPPKQAALHAAALHALYGAAERCVAAGDWRPLAALAGHARAIVGDLRNRPTDPAEDPVMVTRRVRLALILAEMDTDYGARQRAMHGFRAAAAYLVRAMHADPHNGSRQRDFARAQERIGDLLAAQGDWPGALDRFRKSLGIRAYLAKQDPAGPERQRDLLRHHLKIGAILSDRDDAEGALQSYRAAHGIIEKLAAADPVDPERRFDLATSYERLASMYVRLGDGPSALSTLRPALGIYEDLAREHPDRLAFVRAPVAVHLVVGDLLRARAELSGALERYRTALGIVERLAAVEPGDAELRRDLAQCHNSIGNTLAGLEDLPRAVAHYRLYLAIAEPLAERQAGGPTRRRELAAGHMKLGMALEQTQDPAGALAEYRKARALLEKLALVTAHNEALRKDLAWVKERIDKLGGNEESVS